VNITKFESKSLSLETFYKTITKPKKMKLKKCFLLGIALVSFGFFAQAQDTEKFTNAEGSEYEFEILRSLERSDVENQGRTGTCWSFSSLSFFEAEVKRITGREVALSPMFVVHHTYEDKAEKYVRMHGHINFAAGGAFHDVAYVIDEYGIVPKAVYLGKEEDTKYHDHGEMDEVLKATVDAIMKRKNPSTKWPEIISDILDNYLGELPTTFEYDGKTYTPKEFAGTMGLNMDDYVSITSFTHHPFYETFDIEVPDNWMNKASYNLPLDEMMEVFNNAVDNGYSIAWGSDVSEKGFNYRAGLAVMPKDQSTLAVTGEDNKNFNDAGAFKYGKAFQQPVEELEITQELRQEAFDNYETTDDHGMHVIGVAKDQNGKRYYIVKNSWGKTNQCDGYFYASEAFVEYKTINFLVHKDALPKKVKKKLGL
jgi:bleomycin hydrolase